MRSLCSYYKWVMLKKKKKKKKKKWVMFIFKYYKVVWLRSKKSSLIEQKTNFVWGENKNNFFLAKNIESHCRKIHCFIFDRKNMNRIFGTM